MKASLSTFFGKNAGRLLLLAAALILLLTAALLTRKARALPGALAVQIQSPPRSNLIKALPIDSLIAASAIVAKPPRWENHDGSLFVPRPYVLPRPKTDMICCDPPPLHPPIKNSWLISNGLPYWEHDVKDQDPDDDHFSNLEEFLANTDPGDKDSVPLPLGPPRQLEESADTAPPSQ